VLCDTQIEGVQKVYTESVLLKVGFRQFHSHWPIRSFTAVQPA